MSSSTRANPAAAARARASKRAPLTDESWFGAFESTAVSETVPAALDPPPAPHRRSRERDDKPERQTEPRVESQPARPRVQPSETSVERSRKPLAPSAFERIYRAFLAARAALAVALVVTLVVSSVFGLRPPIAVAALTLGYAILATSAWLLPRLHRDAAPHTFARLRSPQWLATIGADLIFFTALHAASPGSSFNYVALLVLPVLMAGVLTPRVLALATAAAATLSLFATASLGLVAGVETTLALSQSALAGSGFFVISVLAGELAGRLAREELSARGSLELARQQAQLNRLVIEEMEDGVVVVDRAGRVRAVNPAAQRLLVAEGTSPSAPFQLRGVIAWGPLVLAVERAFAEAAWPEEGRDVPLEFGPGSHRTLRVRVRFTRKREPVASEEFCVLFLEDVRNVQARSRQEKLAAMGRVSAGIAHEIRNPLAAISQANALLSEDATDPGQRALMRMVSDNVERLKRIVDDVMEVAPGQVIEVGVIDATATLAEFAGEWARAVGVAVGGHGVLLLELPREPAGVMFDTEHLRRVLINLLDNAKRHASGAPGAIVVRLELPDEAPGRAVFSVLSDGVPIAADVEPYLFEPFFSTRSRGAGLGLYICRELCERYGARIDYRLLPPDEPRRNEFYVDMRRGAIVGVDSRLHVLP